MATKKKNNRFSLSALEVEVGGEPFVLELDEENSVTFPNPEDMDWKDAEALAALAQSGSATTSDLLKTWLSDEDYATFESQNLSLKQIMSIMTEVAKYYSAFFGTDAGN